MSLLINNNNGQSAPGLVQTTAVGAVNLRAAHTVCMRIRFTSNPTNIDVVPIAFAADADLSGTWMERRNGDAGGAFFAKRWNAGQTLNDQASIGGYTTGWQHMAVTYDATNIRTYLNGALVATTASATTRTSTTTNCRIFIGFGGQYVVTDCGFFGRALTADEILYLKGNRLGIVLSKGDCFGWYPLLFDRFREDYSGRGNDLDDFAGSGTPPAANNEDPGVQFATDYSRVFQVLTSTVAATGDGRTVFNGSGASTSAVADSADGRTVFNGSGARTVAVAESADGRTLFNGSGARTVAIAPTADGRTLFNGSGTASTSGDINATGDGRTAFNGAGTLTAAAVGVGDGRTVFNGSASATVAVSTSGDGRTLFNGLGDTQVQLPALPPQARGSGRRTTWIWTNPITPLTYATAFSNDRLLEYWHSEQGISLDGSSNVQTWTGQLRGFQFTQATAGRRPLYGADGVLFNGKSVLQSASARSMEYLAGASIFDVSARPALMYVARFRSAGLSFLQDELGALAGPNFGIIEDYIGPQASPKHVAKSLGTGSVITSASVPTDLSPRLTCIGLTASDLELWTNGQKVAGALTSRNLREAIDRVELFALTPSGTFQSDGCCAMLFLLRSMPTQFEQLQIYELAKTEWGI